MKLPFVTIFVTILLHCNFPSAAGLQCYQCVYYEGISSIQAEQEPSDPSCKMNGSPDSKSLGLCKEHTGTCALINVSGKDHQDKPFKMTIRQCLSKKPSRQGCHDMDYRELVDLPGIRRDMLELLPNAKKDVDICTCTKEGCNKNKQTASDNSCVKANAVLTTASNLGFVGCVVLLFVIEHS